MKKLRVSEKLVCEEYLKGESALTIQKKYPITYHSVYRILERNGIKRRSPSEKTINARLQGRDTHSKKWYKAMKDRWTEDKNPRWKPIGSKKITTDRYIDIKFREGYNMGNWMPEQNYIIEKHIGRKLRKGEIVHHINKDKQDNRLENLQLMKQKEHKILHLKDNLFKN